MFEYAISDGEGTLIDYGVKSASGMDEHYMMNVRFHSDGVMSALDMPTEEYRRAVSSRTKERVILFRSTTGDCETGK